MKGNEIPMLLYYKEVFTMFFLFSYFAVHYTIVDTYFIKSYILLHIWLAKKKNPYIVQRAVWTYPFSRL